jgi:EAL domain-containing protein (putative c-di-GMP-specific phosphodiesterase class I)
MEMDLKDTAQIKCHKCADHARLDFDFSYAFQPIVDIGTSSIFSYEALVRGVCNEPAGEIYQQVNQDNIYRFDQSCRVKAIDMATRLGIDCRLNINFFPNAVYQPELCIRTTVAAARAKGFPIENIIFEVIEGEVIRDHAHLANIINYYKKTGFSTAIDDFGSGYAGLNLLAEYQPDFIKLDRQLVTGIHLDSARQSIARAVIQVCQDLQIGLLAEGVEEISEVAWFAGHGVKLFQGNYFAEPGFEMLPAVAAERLNNGLQPGL